MRKTIAYIQPTKTQSDKTMMKIVFGLDLQ